MRVKIYEKRSLISHTKRWSEQPDLRQSNLIELGFGFGAGGRTRTDMSLTSPDFESGAYTNFATPA